MGKLLTLLSVAICAALFIITLFFTRFCTLNFIGKAYGEQAFTVINDDFYPWEYDEVSHTYSSTNKTDECAGTASAFSVVLNADGDLSFLYRTSSEERWDRLIIKSVKGGVTKTEYTFSGEMTDFQTVGITELKAGDTVSFTYSKSISNSYYDDAVYIKDLQLINTPQDNEEDVQPKTLSLFVGRAVGGVCITIDGEDFVTDENGIINIPAKQETDSLNYYNKQFETPQNAHTLILDGGSAYTLEEAVESVFLCKAEEQDYIKVYDREGGVVRDFNLCATLSYFGGGTQYLPLTVEREGGGNCFVYAATLSSDRLNAAFSATVKEATADFARFISSVQSLRQNQTQNFLTFAQNCWEQYQSIVSGATAEEVSFAESYLAEWIENVGNIAKSAVVSGGVTYGDSTVQLTVCTFNGSTFSPEVTVARKDYYIDEFNAVCVTANYSANYGQIEYVINVLYSSVNRLSATVAVQNQSAYYGDKIEVDQTAYTASGVLEGDDLGVKLTKEDGGAVGKYAVTGSAANGFYNVSFTDGEFIILRRPVTVIIDNKSSVYGEEFEELTYSAQGVLQGDNLNVTLTKAEGDAVGEYEICGDCQTADYAVTYVKGTYTITPLPLTVTVSDGSCVYGEEVNLNYSLSVEKLPYGDRAGELFTLIRQSGENAGKYAVTATATENENYEINFVYSDVENGCSYFEITRRYLQITVNDTAVEPYLSYGEMLKRLSFNITQGTLAYGQSADGLGVKLFASSNGTVLNAENYNSLIRKGNVIVGGECADTNYEIDFSEGSLILNKIKVGVNSENLSALLSGREYTGGRVFADFIWENVWADILTGNLTNATCNDFAADFKDGDGNAVYDITEAGEYTVEIVIKDNCFYEFNVDCLQPQSRTLKFSVSKKDVSGFIGLDLVWLDGGKAALLNEDCNLVTCGGYSVTPVVTITLGGASADGVSQSGQYEVSVKINDKNLFGERAFNFTLVNSVRGKIDRLNSLLKDYEFNGKAAVFDKMREIFRGFTQDDLSQINQVEEYSAAVANCHAAYEDFKQKTKEDMLSVEDVSNRLFSGGQALIAVATTMAAMRFIKRWQQ